jgi:predicted NBD/HSP70 family sugar kinase
MQVSRDRELDLLAIVHARPGITRADAMRTVGVSSGRAVDLVTRLEAASLVAERPAGASGRRGRPSTELVAHPKGPLVVALSLRHDGWRACVATLGGGVVATVEAEHDAMPEATVRAMALALRRLRLRYGTRVRAVSIAVPAVVRGGVVLQASNLGWRDVDLRRLWPRPHPDVPVVVGNDASFAGWAEHTRGAARGYASALHLHVDSGLGGVHLVGDAPPPGDTDLGGEFGHMPFGNPALVCECGAHGCWDLMVDGRALARELGRPAPRDPAAHLRRHTASSDQRVRRALETITRALGVGTAGLVNALDPHVVTYGGTAADLLAECPAELDAAYRAGLMAFRRTAPPPVKVAALGSGGPLIGAVEVGFARVLTRAGLAGWLRRSHPSGV